MSEPRLVNGKHYPMWQSFVDQKEKFIGWLLTDMDSTFGPAESTEVIDVTLEPNGKESAFFSVVGKDYTCGFDVSVGGMNAVEGGGIKFHGYAGHAWTLTPKAT